MAIAGRLPVLPSKCRNGKHSAPPTVTAEVRVPLPPKVTERTARAAFSSGILKLDGMTMRAELITLGLIIFGVGAVTTALAGVTATSAFAVEAGAATDAEVAVTPAKAVVTAP